MIQGIDVLPPDEEVERVIDATIERLEEQSLTPERERVEEVVLDLLLCGLLPETEIEHTAAQVLAEENLFVEG